MILVTGGCGYIGSHIVKQLSEIGEEVVVVDDLSHGRAEALLHNETLLRGDITDPVWLKSNLGNYHFDSIIHLAALVNAAESVQKHVEYHRVNYLGTQNLLEIVPALGVKNFVFASSAAVYGNPKTTTPLPEDAPTIPTNPYGQTKLDSEKLIMDSGLNYGILRFFNVAGADESGKLKQARDNNAIISRLLWAAKNNESVVISGSDYPTQDGTVVRDFVHVTDIARGLKSMVEHLRSGKVSQILNLGSGQTTSMQELVGLTSEVTKKHIATTYGPRKVGDIIYSCSDPSRAKETLGWQAQLSVRSMVQSAWSAINV